MSVTVSDFIDLYPGTPQPQYEVNAPRAWAKIDGVVYQLASYSIENTAHGATNTATVTLTIAANPDFSITLFRGDTGQETGAQIDTKTGKTTALKQPAIAKDTVIDTPVQLEIFAAFATGGRNPAPNSGVRRFVGLVDEYTMHLDASSYTVEFACRSLASYLVDTKVTTNTLSPQATTVDFIAKQVAAIPGQPLQFKYDPALSPATLATVFNGTDTLGLKNLRVWDIILMCAEWDDADVWEEDGTLYYWAPGNIPDAKDGKAKPGRQSVNLTWLSDIESMTGTHSPNFNRNVEVSVRSYLPRTKSSVTSRIKTNALGGVEATVTTSESTTQQEAFNQNTQRVTTTTLPDGTKVTSSVGSVISGGNVNATASQGTESNKERYVIYAKGINAEQATTRAQNLWRRISQHEYSITVSVPMTRRLLSALTITSKLFLWQVPYQYFNSYGNRYYWPRRITESFSTSGWTLQVEAVNHVLPQGAV